MTDTRAARHMGLPLAAAAFGAVGGPAAVEARVTPAGQRAAAAPARRA